MNARPSLARWHSSSLLTSSQNVRHLSILGPSAQADTPIVPLATLVTASLPPSSPKSEGSKPAILSEGKRRFFICHGGPPVSKDGVTLDEVVKIERFGRQPGQEGIMCEVGFLFRICLEGLHDSLFADALDRSTSTGRPRTFETWCRSWFRARRYPPLVWAQQHYRCHSITRSSSRRLCHWAWWFMHHCVQLSQLLWFNW